MTALPPSSPPPASSYILATALLSLATGYLLGQASSLGLLPSFLTPASKTRSKSKKESWPNSYDVTLHPDSSDEDLMTHLNGGKPKAKDAEKEVPDSEDEDSEGSDEDEVAEGGELKTFTDNSDDCKLVLVVRTDLGMGKGKIAAQASHATLACYTALLRSSPSPQNSHPLLQRWQRTGQAKICLQVPSEEELQTLQAQAMSVGLCAQIIHDAGRTQIAAGSATVLGVGPGPRGVVDGVTGGLKLL